MIPQNDFDCFELINLSREPAVLADLTGRIKDEVVSDVGPAQPIQGSLQHQHAPHKRPL